MCFFFIADVGAVQVPAAIAFRGVKESAPLRVEGDRAFLEWFEPVFLEELGPEGSQP